MHAKIAIGKILKIFPTLLDLDVRVGRFELTQFIRSVLAILLLRKNSVPGRVSVFMIGPVLVTDSIYASRSLQVNNSWGIIRAL